MTSFTRLALFALCLMGAGLTTAHAASFDCAKAGNATEKAICANPGLSQQDEAMAALYQRQLEVPDAGRWATFLRRDQRDWIRVRNSHCGAKLDCLTQDYQRRITYLGHPLLPWTGRYVEGRCPKDGRFLDVTPSQDGTLDIEIYICPDPRGNMLLQSKGVLDAQQRLVIPDGGRCTRSFQFSADRIVVTDLPAGQPECVQSPVAGSFARDPRRSPFEQE